MSSTPGSLYRHVHARAERRGSAFALALLAAVALAALAGALLATNLGNEGVRVQHGRTERTFYAAEAGLSEAYARMTAGLITPDDLPFSIGSREEPVRLGPTGYWVEIEQVGSYSYSIRSTGVNDRTSVPLELVLRREPTGFFQYAAFGAEGVELSSNALIDSYNSELGSYDSQVKGGNSFALENGHVGSNEDLTLRSNTQVHGNCQPGPSGVLNDSAPGTYVSGSKEPLEEKFEMPEIEVPAIPTAGSQTVEGDVVLGPGLVHYDSLLVKGGATLTIRGPATVVLDDFQMKSGGQMIFDASGGEIDLHGTGDFILESNTDMETLSSTARDLTILLSGNNMDPGKNDRIQLSSNADFVGAIYAPRISYNLDSNFNVYGSIICGMLGLGSNGEIHFDEALLFDDDGDEIAYDLALWRELPLQ
jgi:hypothetical protein